LTPFLITSEDKNTYGRLIQENAKGHTTNNSMNILAPSFCERGLCGLSVQHVSIFNTMRHTKR